MVDSAGFGRFFPQVYATQLGLFMSRLFPFSPVHCGELRESQPFNLSEAAPPPQSSLGFFWQSVA